MANYVHIWSIFLIYLFFLFVDPLDPFIYLTVYLSTLQSHQTWMKRRVSRLFYFYLHMHISWSICFWLTSFFSRTTTAASFHTPEVRVLNFLRLLLIHMWMCVCVRLRACHHVQWIIHDNQFNDRMLQTEVGKSHTNTDQHHPKAASSRDMNFEPDFGDPPCGSQAARCIDHLLHGLGGCSTSWCWVPSGQWLAST